jgi:DNA processing protein
MRADREQLELLALCRIKGLDWHLVAREAQRPDGLDRLVAGRLSELTGQAELASDLVREAVATREARLAEVRAEVARAEEAGARLLTVLDDDYPRTLRLIYNLPPFLFVRGGLVEQDLRSVAVVGTRNASPDGCRRAQRLAGQLSEAGVTVVSGLARGIDTAAHTAALAAGGRTIAVVGTGITRCYPAENAELSDQIAASGAVVSQFWPSAPPASYTFPRRNVTMSGIAQGTVVIEASATSGAKMQARLALEHGKKVFLLRSLVERHEWAASYAQRRGARVVESVDDVVRELVRPDAVRADDARRLQLSLLD